jgi:hypothetical protein
MSLESLESEHGGKVINLRQLKVLSGQRLVLRKPREGTIASLLFFIFTQCQQSGSDRREMHLSLRPPLLCWLCWQKFAKQTQE